MRIIGVDHVPKEGGVIVAANHNSYFDIPLIGCALPRPADNIAKSDLFKLRPVALFFEKMGGFPVRRGAPDRRAIAEAVRRVRAGRLLVIYPEGTRSKDGRLQKGKPGIGKSAADSGAIVVPAWIEGTYRIRPFRRVTIRFGRPLDFRSYVAEAKKEGVHQKTVYATIVCKIMSEIASLQTTDKESTVLLKPS